MTILNLFDRIYRIMSDITSSSRSAPIDSCSTGTNISSPSIPPVVYDGQSSEFIAMLQEDRIRVMHKRTVALFNENILLKEQISEKSRRAEELEEKLSRITETFSKGEIYEDKKRGNDVTTEVGTALSFNPLEKLQQAICSVCKSCHKKLQKNEMEEPVTFITKVELDLLEKDIQTLRDALALKEQAWNKIVDREQNYCRQLTRLAQEVITTNQLADNRYEDLQKMARTIEEKDFELKIGQKEIMHLKKIIVKQEKRYRALDNGNEPRAVGAEINDRERKWIEEIMRQLSSTRRRQKSMGHQQNSPRHGSNRNSARDMSLTTKDL